MRYLILFFFPLSLFSQTISSYSYTGAPGEAFSEIFPSQPGQLYQLDINAFTIADRVTVINGVDTILLAVGTGCHRGMPAHGGFIYLSPFGNDTLSTPPSDFTLDYTFIGGLGRIEFITNLCEFEILLEGNDSCMTVFNYRLTLLESIPSAPIAYDTVKSCQMQDRIIYNCDTILYRHYTDETPVFEYEIRLPGCKKRYADLIISDLDVFPSPYNLPEGTHEFTVSNDICSKELTIDIIIPECPTFIPNSFSPNNDGVNDEFQPYNKYGYDYTMRIFDRWGNLVYEGEEPWNGGESSSGVYAYIIQLRDEMYYGDVTLFR